MSLEDRARWDERHRRVGELKPRASVLELPRAASPHSLALDLACGQGRHALALGRCGYRVLAMDASREALRRTAEARDREAPDLAAQVLPIQADAEAWPFAPDVFDVIVQVDFLDRSLFPYLRSSLRHGGLLLIDTFLDLGRPNAGGPSSPSFLLAPGELPRIFADFSLLRYEEMAEATARAVFVARRP
jgi:tellurite methyltransferase